jgi:hypothetical protein
MTPDELKVPTAGENSQVPPVVGEGETPSAPPVPNLPAPPAPPVQDGKKENGKKAEKPKEIAKKDSDLVEGFFEQFPKAPSVLKVGNQLFLPMNSGAADYTASLLKVTVEVFENPNLTK